LGYGLIYCLLEDVNVISTDPFTFYNVYKNMILFYDVEKYNNANILMLIWPPAEGMEGSNMSYDSLKLFKGNKLIYIGEYMGGLTGSEKFIELLNKEWKLVQKYIFQNGMILSMKVYSYTRENKYTILYIIYSITII